MKYINKYIYILLIIHNLYIYNKIMDVNSNVISTVIIQKNTIKNKINIVVISVVALLVSVGTFLIFKKTNSSTTINDATNNNIINNGIAKDNTEYNENEMKKAKKLGYDILLSTMEDYIDKYKNKSFDDFMKKMWIRDYEIMIKTRNGDEGYTRDYSEWKNIFEMMIPAKEFS